MKRAFLLLVLLCLLPIHALAQFITVPDEIYEALLADEVISSYASTKEELLPLITTLEGCDENNQAECAVIVTPPDGNPELLMLGKIDGHWQITTRSSSVLLNIDIEPFLYEERYAEIQLYYSSEEDERNGVPHAVLTFQREWDDKAGLHWYLTLLTLPTRTDGGCTLKLPCAASMLMWLPTITVASVKGFFTAKALTSPVSISTPS